jgi:uncharacterized protein YbaR (Trm112 family)
MFIELVDVLRCPEPHEETWLVLAATHVVDRDVMEGTLGCPVCAAEYPIVNGVARFDRGMPHVAEPSETNEEEALRLAAQLNLADPRGYAVLVGATAAQGPLVATMTGVQLLLVDPPPEIGMGLGISGLTTPAGSAMLPLARASARGIALDAATSAERARAAVEVVRTGGRLVAPISLELPDGLAELARDDRVWVAERSAATATSGVISLTRKH